MTEQKPPSPTAGFLVAGCGCLLTLIAMAVGAFGAYHVILDPRGKISGDEAAPAFAGGVCCALGSLVIFLIGAFVAYQAKQKAAALEGGGGASGAQPAAPAQPPEGGPGQ